MKTLTRFELASAIKPELQFDPKQHVYFVEVNGERKLLTGVTSIIKMIGGKEALLSWAAKMAVEYLKPHLLPQPTLGLDWETLLDEAKSAHTKKKEAAGAHGTDAHALVEEYINDCISENHGQPVRRVGVEYWEPIEPLILWALENVDYFLFSERRMMNLELAIAGTADFAYVSKDGKRMMGDFKTSSGVYGIDYFAQVAGYRFLAESEGDEPYEGTTIVRHGKKDGKFEVINRFDYETDKEAFLAALTLYRANATFIKPKK